VERLLLISEWGFPMTCTELRHLIKAYLDGLGKTTRFVDNLPGPDFVKGFMKRHPRLTIRTTSMIKRARAAVSSKVVEDFFKRFAKTAEGVPPTHIYNYDESGLKDDPGADKAIFRKGVKYAEQIRYHTKSQISVMFCGTISGKLLPPYVIYKAANCWESWRQRGPDGARYTATPSGWFEGSSFTDWFKKVLLPDAKKLPGKKVLIGDNLSSHINMEVISLCASNNIEFVCLPPNSTHLLQPLDVGIFGPMKQAWRVQLKSYSAKDPTAKLLNKSDFPGMLKAVLWI
jgi:hypothetical protein